MKTKEMKLIAVLAVLAMVFAGYAAVADSEEDGVRLFFVQSGTTLKSVVSTADAGDTIQLTSDTVLDDTISVDKKITLDLNGYTLSKTAGHVIDVVSGGDLTITGTGNSKVSCNSGSLICVKGAEGSPAKLTVSSGSFSAREACVVAKAYSDVTINGGTFTSTDNGVVMMNGTVDPSNPNYGVNAKIAITGGTFNASIESQGYIAMGVYAANTESVQITGGTFNVTNGVGVAWRSGNLKVTDDAIFNISGSNTMTGKAGDSSDLVRAGQTIACCPATGYASLGTYEGSAYFDAKIDNIYYSTLAETIAAVEVDGTVTVLKDITATSPVMIGKKFTLDFDNHKLTSSGLGNGNMVQVGGFGEGPSVAGFTIRGCEFVGGSGMTSTNCIQVETSGEVTVSGCTFHDFDGLNRETRVVGTSQDASLTVSGCSFDASMGYEVDVVKISGLYSGFAFTDNTILDGAPEGSQFCVASYKTSDEKGYTIAVPEAKVGDIYYKTLSEAIAAVEVDGTVTVLKDITATSSVMIGKRFTLDFDNHKLTSSGLGNNNMVQVGGFGVGPSVAGFTIRGCEFFGGSGMTLTNCIQVETSGEVTVSGCTFHDFDGLNREIRVVGTSQDASLTVSECKFDASMGYEVDVVKISGQYSGFVFTDNTILEGAPEGSQFCVASYKTSDEKGYTIAVPEAKVGDIYYKTFYDAFNASTSGQTVTVFVDVYFTTDFTVKEGVSLVIGEGKTFTIDGTGMDPATLLILKAGASFSGSFKYVYGEETNSAVFTNLKAGAEDIIISHGSIIITGTISASDTVTIESNGDVKLNGVTIDGTEGSLVITKTGEGSSIEIEDLTVSEGASVNINADVTMSGTNNVNNGTLSVSNGAELTVSTGSELDNNGTIYNDTESTIVNNGSIESSESKGTIINSGTIGGSGTIDPSVKRVDSFSITLDKNGGSQDGSAKAYYGSSSLTDFTGATRTGYISIGYYTADIDGVKVISSTGSLKSNVEGYTDADGKWIKEEDTTLYAHWIEATYSITLNGNGGLDGSATVDYQSTALNEYNRASYAGHTLTGYFTSASGGTKVINNDGSLVSSASGYTSSGKWVKADDCTLYAQWTVNKYTVTLDKNGGSADKTVTVTYGSSTVSGYSSLSRTGYSVDGYYTSPSGGSKVIRSNGTLIESVSGYTDSDGKWILATDATLYAQWTAKQYTVTLNANGGSPDSSVIATYDQTLPYVSPITRTGYNFDGYCTSTSGDTRVIRADGVMLSSVSGYSDQNGNWIRDSSATLYAKWNGKTTEITLDLNGGTSGSTSATVTYGQGMPSFTLATKTDLGLKGYYTAAEGGAKVINESGKLIASVQGYTDSNGKWALDSPSLTLYAQWGQLWTVTYDPCEGTVSPTSSSVVDGSSVTLPTPAREGHVFKGWYTEAAEGIKVDSPYAPTGSITLYAHWAEAWTVTYDANGGTVSPAKVLVEKGASANLPTPSKEGFTFDGWFTQLSAGTKVESPYTPTASVTLYAHWTEIPVPKEEHSITVENDGHGRAVADKKEALEGVIITLTVSPYDEYEFDKWSVTSPESLTITKMSDGKYQFTMPDSEVKVKALFAPFKYVDVEKKVSNGSVIIPAALAEKLKITDESKLDLRIDYVSSPSQSNIPKDAKAYDISLKCNGKSLTTFSQKIEVKITYSSSGKDLKGYDVYYVSEDGKEVEDMNAVYKDGGFVFSTDHLSTYAVSPTVIEPVKEKTFDTKMIMIIVAIIILVVILAAILILTRKKKQTV